MKNSIQSKNAILGVIAFCLTFVKSFAQSVPDKKVDVDISTGNETMWYGNPIVWIIGVAVFVIIIIAITRNSKDA